MDDQQVPMSEVMAWLKFHHPDLVGEAVRKVAAANERVAEAIQKPPLEVAE